MGWVGAGRAAGPLGTLRGELAAMSRGYGRCFVRTVAIEFTVWGRIE